MHLGQPDADAAALPPSHSSRPFQQGAARGCPANFKKVRWLVYCFHKQVGTKGGGIGLGLANAFKMELWVGAATATDVRALCNPDDSGPVPLMAVCNCDMYDYID